MGRRSIKADKSVYQQKREELGLTRETAAERLVTISPERLVRLENEPGRMQPEDVLELSAGYQAPELMNWYCRHDCAIGRETGRDIELKPLAQIAVETLSAMNRMEEIRSALPQIALDGKITPDEYETFSRIEGTLEQLAVSVDSLKLWVRNAMAGGDMAGYSEGES